MVYCSHTAVHHRIIRGLCLVFLCLAFRRATCAIYPFPAWGSPYQTADHFWPFQNITGGLLDDVQGAAHTIVYNGGRIRKVSQLGTSLFLDGKDDWVDTGKVRECSELHAMKFGCGFNADCVTDPTRCKEGFTLAFWLKVYGSGYVMSSGSFTNSPRGPGFRLLYDTKIQGFEFVLETATKRWRLHVQADTNKWIHMIFSWKESVGIEYYEDGNLSTFSGPKPYFLSSRPKKYTPVITLGRPNKVLEVRNFGYFEIAQFAIWMKWLSSSDAAGVYLNGVVYDQDTAVCCYFKSVGICTSNPCYDPKQCKRIEDTHQCICPRVSLRLKTCQAKIKGYCADKLKSCNIYSRQAQYCKHKKMREVCPRSCLYCAPGSTSTKVLRSGTTKETSSIRSSLAGSSSIYSTHDGLHSATRLPFITPTIQPSSSSLVPYVMPSSSPPYGNLTRVMRRGKDCNTLQCLYYATCEEYKDYAECKCKEGCTYEYAPVCGTNSKTYINPCVLKQDSCMLGHWIRIAKKGSCGEYAQGSRYPGAAHYWPFNGTSGRKTLSDLRGKGKAITYNGVKTTRAEQIGSVVSLDGIDDYVFINNFRSKCINDPTRCSRGLTVAFWIKYHAGEFILSGGRYTDANEGPGFRFICSNCASASPSASSTEKQRSKRFVLNLSTQSQDWTVSLDFLPKAWFHFAFTWRLNSGLKVYKNGKLLSKTNEPETVKYRPLTYDTIVIGRPNSLTKMHYYGKFDIGHLVIWSYELSAYEVEVAFLTVLAKTTKSLLCCHFKKADPCLVNPCYNGASCRSIDEKFECICPDISQGPCDKQKQSSECIDRSDDCALHANKDNACYSNKKFMSAMCAKTCKYCGSGAVAKKTFTRPSPTLIDSPVLSTSGPRLPYTKGTRAPTRRINVLSPTPTPYPTVAQPHRCPLGKGSRMECICMNCEGNTSPGLMCCTEQLYRNDMEQGIALIISSFPMMGFLPKVASLRKLAEELINDECSKTRCFDDKIVRKKRNAKEFDYGTPIKRWDGSPITPTNAVRPNSKRDAASTAPRIQKPLDVNVVMFKISQHPSENRDLYTAFYASVDGTNETQILNADVLERLVRSKKSLLERGLNITIDRVSQWRAFRDKYSIGPKSVSSTVASSSSSSISPGGGSPSIENPQASNSTANMSKSTFIIVLVLGIGGFVVLAIIIIYMLVKFLRRMKGEFVPDKAYPNEQKSEAGSDQLIPSFIDPSTPRITDVPKKTVRQPTAANSSGVAPGGGGVGGPGGPGGSTTGGNSGGTKKAKKPMGVKVTYKPPKWD